MYEWKESYLGRHYLSVVAVVAALAVGMVAGYMFGLRNVRDNGTGVDAIGSQLDQAGADLSDAAGGIDAAQTSAGHVAAGIDSAQESVEYLQQTTNSSAEIIEQCKSIISRVRRRGTQDPPAH